METNLGLFHLGTPKTAFLMRNLPAVPCNLGIFPSKQGHSFQFVKNSRGGLPLLPGSFRLLTILIILCILPKNDPEISRIYGFYFE